jgi:hypothetical protein
VNLSGHKKKKKKKKKKKTQNVPPLGGICFRDDGAFWVRKFRHVESHANIINLGRVLD